MILRVMKKLRGYDVIAVYSDNSLCYMAQMQRDGREQVICL